MLCMDSRSSPGTPSSVDGTAHCEQPENPVVRWIFHRYRPIQVVTPEPCAPSWPMGAEPRDEAKEPKAKCQLCRPATGPVPTALSWQQSRGAIQWCRMRGGRRAGETDAKNAALSPTSHFVPRDAALLDEFLLEASRKCPEPPRSASSQNR
jgi:hypothetical protein